MIQLSRSFLIDTQRGRFDRTAMGVVDIDFEKVFANILPKKNLIKTQALRKSLKVDDLYSEKTSSAGVKI